MSKEMKLFITYAVMAFVGTVGFLIALCYWPNMLYDCGVVASFWILTIPALIAGTGFTGLEHGEEDFEEDF